MNSFKLDSKRSLIIMSREGNFRSSQLDSEFLEFLEHHHQAHNGWLMRSNFFFHLNVEKLISRIRRQQKSRGIGQMSEMCHEALWTWN
jgi:hypothetical protein